MKAEYKVREVKRYAVTRYAEDGKSTSSMTRGVFDNFDTAYHVGYAMARLEHEQLGYPVGDDRIQYPEYKSTSDVAGDPVEKD